MRTLTSAFVFALLSLAASGGTLIGEIDITADRAVSMTGAQSNRLEEARSRQYSFTDPRYWIDWRGPTGTVYEATTKAWHLVVHDYILSEGEGGAVITNAAPGTHRMVGLPNPLAEFASGASGDGWTAYCDDLYITAGSSTAEWQWSHDQSTNDFDLALVYPDPSLSGGGLSASMRWFTVTNIVGIIPPLDQSAYTWQGSKTIPSTHVTTNYGGYASGSNLVWLIPPTAAKHSVTGTVDVTGDRYVTGVSFMKFFSKLSGDLSIPTVSFRDYRTSPTSWRVEAVIDSAPYLLSASYFAGLSNLVVYTFDRFDMQPLARTNDAAGITALVDGLTELEGAPLTEGAYGRNVVNASSLRRYVDARKDELADHAWARTPRGLDAPEPGIVTIDEPLVQQGAVATLQSGDWYMFSYEGGDWYSATTGSVWRVGPSGRVAFEINSTNRMLHISSFSVTSGVAAITVATNWLSGTPSIEYSAGLIYPQWLACPAQVGVNNVSNWVFTCPATAGQRFFRAIDPSGDNYLRSAFRHQFDAGVTLGGVTLNAWPQSGGVSASIVTGIVTAATSSFVASSSVPTIVSALAPTNGPAFTGSLRHNGVEGLLASTNRFWYPLGAKTISANTNSTVTWDMPINSGPVTFRIRCKDAAGGTNFFCAVQFFSAAITPFTNNVYMERTRYVDVTCSTPTNTSVPYVNYTQALFIIGRAGNPPVDVGAHTFTAWWSPATVAESAAAGL